MPVPGFEKNQDKKRALPFSRVSSPFFAGNSDTETVNHADVFVRLDLVSLFTTKAEISCVFSLANCSHPQFWPSLPDPEAQASPHATASAVPDAFFVCL